MQRLANWWSARWQAMLARRRLNRDLALLASMSGRELQDLGIARSELLAIEQRCFTGRSTER
ncbi:DUF1127 domain-containing protein [Chitinolyticbacter meiyuanensis]|uniref:DUF1127 domain-containing protein n=1 Tax=Chitinolyticbacter meiyuanensis TaxID=682798 RepID=UPI0011E5C097|nr:DUF1127 domain-containing protein [Chitinolyticbacter meiyuanensis]